MATVQDSSPDAAAANARSSEDRKYRFDTAHTDLPLLARIPDLRDVLAEAASNPTNDEPTDSSAPVTDQPPEEQTLRSETATSTEAPPAAPELNLVQDKQPLATDSEEHDEFDTEPLECAATASRPIEHINSLPAPKFTRRRATNDRSLVQRALALPSNVPDSMFWSTICGVLILVAVTFWFNREPATAELPNAWENSTELNEPDATVPVITEQAPFVESNQSAPRLEEPTPSVADQVPDRTGPTLADPSVSSYPDAPTLPYGEATKDTSSNSAANYHAVDQPGMARLHGIIEQPDMRATNERTESSLH